MKTALFISPHLDDAVFSCGGMMALLAESGWRTVLATVFTRSVTPVSGFALACQLDKGLPADVDYMALRRAEDLHAAAILSVSAVHWLDFAEAPHRGYHTAAELFGDVHMHDDVSAALIDALSTLVARLDPNLVLAPQGLGNHVDHQHTTRSILKAASGRPLAFYADVPYAIRNPVARPLACVPHGLSREMPIDTVIEQKIAAVCAYASQISFQFGGVAECGTTLGKFKEAVLF